MRWCLAATGLRCLALVTAGSQRQKLCQRVLEGNRVTATWTLSLWYVAMEAIMTFQKPFPVLQREKKNSPFPKPCLHCTFLILKKSKTGYPLFWIHHTGKEVKPEGTCSGFHTYKALTSWHRLNVFPPTLHGEILALKALILGGEAFWDRDAVTTVQPSRLQ